MSARAVPSPSAPVATHGEVTDTTVMPIDARSRDIRLRHAAIDAMISEGLALAGISDAGGPSLHAVLTEAGIAAPDASPAARRREALTWTADKLLADPHCRDALARLIALSTRATNANRRAADRPASSQAAAGTPAISAA